jgi:hypothetical protein
MDKTAEGKSRRATQELLTQLDELVRTTGVRLAVSTNHFFDGDSKAMTALLADDLSPETLKGMFFITQSGARIHRYDAAGNKPSEPLWQDAAFTDAEHAALAPVFSAAAAKVGLEAEDWNLMRESDRSIIELRGQQDKLQALRDALAEASAAKGWPYRVDAKPMPTARNVPYVQFSRSTKGNGLKQALEFMKADGLVKGEEQVLIIGDDFGEGGNDLYMARALPQALAISVGKATTARQPNLIQWSTTGENGTRQILRDLLETLTGVGKRD